MDKNAKLSEHFTYYELARSETAARKGLDNTPPENLIPKLRHLCEHLLEPIRQHYGKPFRPNSGYRSIELNKEIGGSPTSQHCLAEAVDIEIPGVSNYDLSVWIRDNLEFDKLILECYDPGIPNSGWVHVSLKKEGDENRRVTLTYSERKYTEGLIA